MTCKICGSKTMYLLGKVEFSHRGYRKNSTLVQCDSCGTHWIYPYPDLEKLAKMYAGTYHYVPNKLLDMAVNFIYQRELAREQALIQRYKHKGKVLDIGAGRGDLLKRFGGKWDRWAYDPYLSDDDIKMLKQKIGKHVNDFSQLKNYPSNFYDVVIIRNIIEHTTETKILLRDISRILKKGGVLFIRTPNIGSLDFKLFRTDWYVVKMNGHVVFWDPRSITNVLNRKGFVVKEVIPTSGSSPLSLARSIWQEKSMSLRLPVSVGYALLSRLFNNGGDMIVIAQK